MEHRLVTRSGRFASVLLAAVLFLALPLFFATVAIGDGGLSGRIAAGIGLIVAPALGYWLTRGAFGPRPSLIVDPGGITIVHPRLLLDSARIDRTNIRIARICHGAPGVPFAANVQRFSCSDGPGAVAGHRWAFDFKNGSMFPTLTAVAAAPTVLIAFRDPVKFPVRHLLPRVLIRPGLWLPRREPVTGVMLCVRDPEDLEDSVGSWGEPGPIATRLAS